MSNRILLTAIMILAFLSITVAYAQEKKASDSVAEKKFVVDVGNVKCPVMGGDSLKELFAVHDGKIYHFCCPGCIPTFKKAPASYIAKVKPAEEKDQKRVEIVGNEKCPVTGDPINKELMVIKDGKLYFVCCEDCLSKFAKSEGDNSGHDNKKDGKHGK